MTIYDQFMPLDVVPLNAQPYGYSMGPQATSHAMASFVASTAATKEKNDDWAPFVVVVLCGTMVLILLFGCSFYLLCRKHIRDYLRTVQTKLPSSPAPTLVAGKESSFSNASTSGRGLLRDIEKVLRRISRDASQPIDTQEKHYAVKLPSDMEIGVVQNAERVRPTRAVATVLRGFRSLRPSSLRKSHADEIEPEPLRTMNHLSRFLRVPHRSQTAPVLSQLGNDGDSDPIQVNSSHLSSPINLPVGSSPSPSSINPPPMYSITQDVPPYTVRVVPSQAHRSASTPALSPSLSSHRTSADSAERSPTLFYNQHGPVQVPDIKIQPCTPPSVSNVIQAAEQLERGVQSQPADQTVNQEGILAVHREEIYSWNQPHPPTLDVQVPVTRVQQSPSASSATSMRRAVLAASRPRWI